MERVTHWIKLLNCWDRFVFHISVRNVQLIESVWMSQILAVNSLPNNKILDLSKLKAFVDDNLNVYKKK